MDYYNFDDENQIVDTLDYVDVDNYFVEDYNTDEVEWSDNDLELLSFDA
jgi:hypothetical protein